MRVEVRRERPHELHARGLPRRPHAAAAPGDAVEVQHHAPRPPQARFKISSSSSSSSSGSYVVDDDDDEEEKKASTSATATGMAPTAVTFSTGGQEVPQDLAVGNRVVMFRAELVEEARGRFETRTSGCSM